MYLPNDVPEEQAVKGIPIGPPSLEPLGLPVAFDVALHNQLFHRKLFTPRDVRLRRRDVMSAIQAALKVDTERIVQLYVSDD